MCCRLPVLTVLLCISCFPDDSYVADRHLSPSSSGEIRGNEDEPDGPLFQHQLNSNKGAELTKRAEGQNKGRGSKTTRSKTLPKNHSDRDLKRETSESLVAMTTI